MKEEAILLREDGGVSLGTDNIGKVLGFFGVPWCARSTPEFLARDGAGHNSSSRAKVLCSSEVFLRLIEDFERGAEEVRFWQERVHSVFVYAGDDSELLQKLARRLSGDDGAVLHKIDPCIVELVVSDHLNDFCGVMAGLRVAASKADLDTSLILNTPKRNAINIISLGHGAIFLKFEFKGVPVFLSTYREIINIDTELTSQNFDVRDHFLSAVPLVLYVKWAFAETCWSTPETSACLVIDDPLLKPSYGFVNFQELLELMKRHRFSTNIAFIPWNWRRSDREVVRLFKENPEKYSLSIHGCDHTRAEFGSSSQQRLYWKAQQALERMDRHQSITGIRHDRIMVFPQGIFSEAAMRALKRTDLIAAVNNDTISADQYPRAITVSDVWDIGVMGYTFPLFTRRSPWEGIENFAFDALLGKPAIVVIHHDYCSDHCVRLVNFIQRLNALQCAPTWRGLGEVVRRSCRQREVSPGEVEVEMYGTELRIENRFDQPKHFIIRRRECEPSAIQRICAGSQKVAWKPVNSRIDFEIELNPGDSRTVGIRFRDLSGNGQYRENAGYEVKTLLRRYLSEARDNYFMPAKARLARFAKWLGMISDSCRPSSVLCPPSVADEISDVLTDFTEWLRVFGETSWDHQSFFAGSVGGRAKALYYRHPSVGIAAVAPMIFFEAFIPCARRLFHHPVRFPIADAHCAMGFAFLYQSASNPAYLEKAVHFLNVLRETRCRQFKEYCWGYPFDWVTRNGVLKEQTPLITTTPYAYEAFLQVYEIVEQKKSEGEPLTLALSPSSNGRDDSLMESASAWKQILESIARHAASDIKDFRTSETASSCSYTPFGEGGVINAAAYRAFLLTSASQVLSKQEYWRIAERNLNFVLENQNPDGSWFYAVDGVRDFVDHYHTCFVMKALAKVHALTGHAATLKALGKGVSYYQNNLFDADGLPKPFSRAPRLTVYKRELYDCAECINLCLLLRDRFPQMETTLETVIEGILKDWIKPDGSFRSRRLHFGWDNVPMHRWGQSQMFRSLAFYLREFRGPRTDGGGQKSEDRIPKTEDRGQRTEDRGRKTEGQGWRTEVATERK